MLTADRSEFSLPQLARIVRTEQENYRTLTLTFDLSWPEAEPGQFLMAWLPGVDEKPFSLLHNDPLQISVAAVGRFSRQIQRLRPGDPVWLRGPLGHGFRPGPGPMIGVAGGYGVSPIHFLAARLNDGRERHVIIGARTARDLLFAERFRAAGVQVHFCTDDGSAGVKGVVTVPLRPLLAALPEATIYACGPTPMLQAISAICREQQRACQLSWEHYMRCGFGVCGSCARREDGWLACQDGPVEIIPG